MIIEGLGQGLIWSFLAIGVFITFRILDIPDLTAEGSFPLGAAVTIKMMLNGQSALVATFLGFLAGCIAGLFTGLLDTKLHIPSLLAGILTMTGLYSVNIHIMGKANIPLLDQKVLSAYFPNGWDITIQTVVLGGILSLLAVTILTVFFKTETGLALRATGSSPSMSAANGVNTDSMVILGYAISNGFIALSGALVAQSNGFADIGMGIGTIVIGLASVLVGEIFIRSTKISLRLSAMVVGAVIYRLLLTFALNLGISPDDLKILSTGILIVVIVLPMLQSKVQERKRVRNYLSTLTKKEESLDD